MRGALRCAFDSCTRAGCSGTRQTPSDWTCAAWPPLPPPQVATATFAARPHLCQRAVRRDVGSLLRLQGHARTGKRTGHGSCERAHSLPLGIDGNGQEDHLAAERAQPAQPGARPRAAGQRRQRSQRRAHSRVVLQAHDRERQVRQRLRRASVHAREPRAAAARGWRSSWRANHALVGAGSVHAATYRRDERGGQRSVVRRQACVHAVIDRRDRRGCATQGDEVCWRGRLIGSARAAWAGRARARGHFHSGGGLGVSNWIPGGHPSPRAPGIPDAEPFTLAVLADG